MIYTLVEDGIVYIVIDNGNFNTSNFFIAVEELRIRAALLGTDGIIGMKQDIDLDAVGFLHFYMQMYGTAVKYIK